MATWSTMLKASLFVAFLILLSGSTYADDLQALKATAERYVAAMRVVLDTPKKFEHSMTIAQASEYAAAKSAYYNAARQAMPALLQIVRGEDTDSRYGRKVAEIFHGFAEYKEETTGTLKAKCRTVPLD